VVFRLTSVRPDQPVIVRCNVIERVFIVWYLAWFMSAAAGRLAVKALLCC